MVRITQNIPYCASGAAPVRPLPGAGPIAAWARFWRNYFRCSGRASRSEYWWATAESAALVLLGMIPRILRDRRLREEAERRRAAGEDVVFDLRVQGIVTTQQQELFRQDRRAAEQHREETEKAMPARRRVLLHLDDVVKGALVIGVCSLELRRLRDAGYRGRSALLGIIPVVGPVIVTWRCCRPSVQQEASAAGACLRRRDAA